MVSKSFKQTISIEGVAENLTNRVGIQFNQLTMKKSLKNLTIKKEVISKMQMDQTKGGWHPATVFCITNGALNSCPPPGAFCL